MFTNILNFEKFMNIYISDGWLSFFFLFIQNIVDYIYRYVNIKFVVTLTIIIALVYILYQFSKNGDDFKAKLLLFSTSNPLIQLLMYIFFITIVLTPVNIILLETKWDNSSKKINLKCVEIDEYTYSFTKNYDFDTDCKVQKTSFLLGFLMNFGNRLVFGVPMYSERNINTKSSIEFETRMVLIEGINDLSEDIKQKRNLEKSELLNSNIDTNSNWFSNTLNSFYYNYILNLSSSGINSLSGNISSLNGGIFNFVDYPSTYLKYINQIRELNEETEKNKRIYLKTIFSPLYLQNDLIEYSLNSELKILKNQTNEEIDKIKKNIKNNELPLEEEFDNIIKEMNIYRKSIYEIKNFINNISTGFDIAINSLKGGVVLTSDYIYKETEGYDNYDLLKQVFRKIDNVYLTSKIPIEEIKTFKITNKLDNTYTNFSKSNNKNIYKILNESIPTINFNEIYKDYVINKKREYEIEYSSNEDINFKNKMKDIYYYLLISNFEDINSTDTEFKEMYEKFKNNITNLKDLSSTTLNEEIKLNISDDRIKNDFDNSFEINFNSEQKNMYSKYSFDNTKNEEFKLNDYKEMFNENINYVSNMITKINYKKEINIFLNIMILDMLLNNENFYNHIYGINKENREILISVFQNVINAIDGNVFQEASFVEKLSYLFPQIIYSINNDISKIEIKDIFDKIVENAQYLKNEDTIFENIYDEETLDNSNTIERKENLLFLNETVVNIIEDYNKEGLDKKTVMSNTISDINYLQKLNNIISKIYITMNLQKKLVKKSYKSNDNNKLNYFQNINNSHQSEVLKEDLVIKLKELNKGFMLLKFYKAFDNVYMKLDYEINQDELDYNIVKLLLYQNPITKGEFAKTFGYYCHSFDILTFDKKSCSDLIKEYDKLSGDNKDQLFFEKLKKESNTSIFSTGYKTYSDLLNLANVNIKNNAEEKILPLAYDFSFMFSPLLTHYEKTITYETLLEKETEIKKIELFVNELKTPFYLENINLIKNYYYIMQEYNGMSSIEYTLDRDSFKKKYLYSTFSNNDDNSIIDRKKIDCRMPTSKDLNEFVEYIYCVKVSQVMILQNEENENKLYLYTLHEDANSGDYTMAAEVVFGAITIYASAPLAIAKVATVSSKSSKFLNKNLEYVTKNIKKEKILQVRQKIASKVSNLKNKSKEEIIENIEKKIKIKEVTKKQNWKKIKKIGGGTVGSTYIFTKIYDFIMSTFGTFMINFVFFIIILIYVFFFKVLIIDLLIPFFVNQVMLIFYVIKYIYEKTIKMLSLDIKSLENLNLNIEANRTIDNIIISFQNVLTTYIKIMIVYVLTALCINITFDLIVVGKFDLGISPITLNPYMSLYADTFNFSTMWIYLSVVLSVFLIYKLYDKYKGV